MSKKKDTKENKDSPRAILIALQSQLNDCEKQKHGLDATHKSELKQRNEMRVEDTNSILGKRNKALKKLEKVRIANLETSRGARDAAIQVAAENKVDAEKAALEEFKEAKVLFDNEHKELCENTRIELQASSKQHYEAYKVDLSTIESEYAESIKEGKVEYELEAEKFVVDIKKLQADIKDLKSKMTKKEKKDAA